MCLASGLEDEATSRLTRGYLAAEGYGARLGHLEPDRTGEEDRVSERQVGLATLLLPMHMAAGITSSAFL